MAEIISAAQFRSADGTDGWSATDSGATAVFATGSFVRGVELINRIRDLAEAAGHHPDVDLRYPSVRVHLTTHDDGSVLTDKDLALATRISAAATELGIDIDRSA